MNKHTGHEIYQYISANNWHGVKSELIIADYNPFTIKKYGTNGPGIIHWAYLHKKYEIGRKLISMSPLSVLDTVDSPDYVGETVLHMAIIHGNVEEVAFLTSLEVEVDDPHDKRGDYQDDEKQLTKTKSLRHLGRQLVGIDATGPFFAKGSISYFGQSPLLFAVATNQWECVEYIINSQTTTSDKFYLLTKPNSYGDNALHMCMYRDMVGMYKKLLHLGMELLGIDPQMQMSVYTADDENLAHLRDGFTNAINRDGYSPLTLAASLGSVVCVETVIVESGRLMWEYGPSKRWLIPLEGISSRLGPNTAGYQEYKQLHLSAPVPSTLQIICRNICHKIVSIPYLSTLVTKKWKYWGRGIFMFFFVLSIMKTVLLIAVSVSRSNYSSKSENTNESTSWTLYILFLCVCMMESVTELCMLYAYGLNYLTLLYGTARWTSYFNILTTMSVLLSVLASFMGDVDMEIVCFSLTSLLQMLSVTWYLIGFHSTGELIMIILHIVMHDLSTFIVIYTFGIVGFTVPFYVMSQQAPLHIEPIYTPNSPYKVYLVQLSELLFDGISSSTSNIAVTQLRMPWFACFVLILFSLYFTILLLNLLIAMMNESYFKVKEFAEDRWKIELVNMMFRFELMLDAFGPCAEWINRRRLEEYTVMCNDKKYMEVDVVNIHWKKEKNRESSDH